MIQLDVHLIPREIVFHTLMVGQGSGTLEDSPKGEMKSPFSWTSLSKTPTSSTLYFGEPILAELNHEPILAELNHEPTLAKLNQEPALAKINQVKLLCETESNITKSSSIWYAQQHTKFLSSTPS